MLRPPVLSRMLPRWIGSAAAMPARFSTASVLLNTRAPVADLTNCLRLNLMMTPPIADCRPRGLSPLRAGRYPPFEPGVSGAPRRLDATIFDPAPKLAGPRGRRNWH